MIIKRSGIHTLPDNAVIEQFIAGTQIIWEKLNEDEILCIEADNKAIKAGYCVVGQSAIYDYLDDSDETIYIYHGIKASD